MAAAVERERDAAQALRDLLEVVENGDLTVDGPAANAMLRRLEGALIALEALEALTHDGD